MDALGCVECLGADAEQAGELWHELGAHSNNGELDADARALQTFSDSVDACVSTQTLVSWSTMLRAARNSPLVWSSLAAAAIQPKVLAAMAIVAFRRASRPERSLAAIGFYLSLLQQADAFSFGVFQPFAFRDMMNKIKALLLGSAVESAAGRKRKAASPASAKQPQAGKKRRTTSQAAERLGEEGEGDGEADGQGDDDDDDAAAGAETADAAAKENVALDDAAAAAELNYQTLAGSESVAQLSAIVCEFAACFDLYKSSEAAVHFASTSVALTRSARTAVVEMGFAWLGALLRGNFGSGFEARIETLGFIWKHLVRSLLHVDGDAGTGTGAKAGTMRAGAVEFIVQVIRYELGREHSAPGFSAAFADSVHALLQHVAVGVDDRAKQREQVIKSLAAILHALPGEHWLRFSSFVDKLSRNAKISQRMFAVEMASTLVGLARAASLPEPAGGSARLADLASTLTANALKTLVSRMCDKSPKTRARAISALAGAVEQAASVTAQATTSITGVKASVSERDRLCTQASLAVLGFGANERSAGGASMMQVDGDQAAVPTEHMLVWLRQTLQRRLDDAKALVRRGAVQLACALARLATRLTCDSERNVRSLAMLLGAACRDASPLVRKAAVEALCEVTREAHEAGALGALAELWSETVLPLIVDSESSVADRCLEAVQALLLDRLIAADAGSALAWRLLDALQPSARAYLDCAFSRMEQTGKLNGKLAVALVAHIVRAERTGTFARQAWLMLGEFASYAPLAIDEAVVLASWRALGAGSVGSFALATFEAWNEARVLVLKVLVVVSARLSLADGASAVRDIMSALVRSVLDEPPGLVALAMEALVHLPGGTAGWLGELWHLVDGRLASAVHSGQLAGEQNEGTCRLLCALGESASLQDDTAGLSVPRRAVTSVQMLASGASGLAVPGRVRAHAVLALGKLCLAREELARECMPAFGHELSNATDASVRSNVLVVLCDLCMRFTSLVDRFVPQMSRLLADPVPLVRKHALTLLTRLLQEDYIKWRGPLVFRFLRAMADEVGELAEFARCCLLGVLRVRYPTVLSASFVEAIFALNNCTDHAALNAYPQSGDERALFALAGAGNRERRMTVYLAMLSVLSDEEKFGLTSRLCQDVLGGIVDGVLPCPAPDSAFACVLADTFALLTCADIKLAGAGRAGRGADDADGDGAAELEQAKAKLLSKIVKKNTVENILPIAVALKRMLEERRSPLSRELMCFVRELVRDYKSEIADMLAADRTLAAEIEYDIRTLEAAESASGGGTGNTRPAAAPASASRVPVTQLMSPLRASIAASPARQLLERSVPMSAPKLRAVASTPGRLATPGSAPTLARSMSAHSPAAAVAVVHLASPNDAHAVRAPRQWNVTPGAKLLSAQAAEDVDEVRVELRFDEAAPAGGAGPFKLS